jgi:predicted XRE-type DNA-binding protein
VVGKREKNAMKKSVKKKKALDDSAEIESGSIYQQLGYTNYEEMETKANLVIEISKVIKKKRLTQTRASKVLGISQPKLSQLLSGHFRGYSVERLIHFLNELGKDVDIVVKSKSGTRPARVKVYHSNHDCSYKAPIAARAKM